MKLYLKIIISIIAITLIIVIVAYGIDSKSIPKQTQNPTFGKCFFTPDPNVTPNPNQLTEDILIDNIESLIKPMHIAILNDHQGPSKLTPDRFWKIIFDYVYSSLEFKECADGESCPVYKLVTEKEIKEIALKYGFKADKLPTIPKDYKHLFSYDKKAKAYRVDTNSDAENFVYEVVDYKINEDNYDITVIMGYIPAHEDEYDSYEEVYEVYLKYIQPKNEDLSYYIDHVQSTKRKYKLVDRKDKGTVKNPHLRKSRETIDMEKLAFITGSVALASTMYEMDSINKEEEIWCAYAAYIYGYYMYTDMEYKDFVKKEMDEHDDGSEYTIEISKLDLERIASCFDSDFKKLPSVPSNSNIVSYDKKTGVYTLKYSSCATAEDYKVTEWKLDKKKGSGKLGYALYDLDWNKMDYKFCKNFIVLEGEKYEEYARFTYETSFVKNEFKDADIQYSVKDIE